MSRKFIEFAAVSPHAMGNQLKAREGQTSGPMHTGEMGQRFLHSIAKSFVDKLQNLAKDTKYTPQGRRELVQEHATALLAQLRREYKRFLDPLRRAYESFDSTQLTAITPARDAMAAIRRMELRQHLKGLDGGRRREIFDAALAHDDQETLAAYFDRSDLFELLGKEILKAGRTQYLQKHGPEVLDSEMAGSVLAYDVRRIAEDLCLFAEQGEDAKAIFDDLAAADRLGWSFEKSQDLLAIENYQFPSGLPGQMTAGPLSDGQRITSL